MTQFNPILGANLSGLTYRTQDNNAKRALLNHHKGAAAPTYAEAGMIWVDDSATPWLMKVHDGSDWIVLGEINSTTNTFSPYLGAATIRLLNFAADTGSANTYVITPTPAITDYVAGQIVTLSPANANTGSNNQVCTVTLAGNRTLGNPSNKVAGATYVLIVKQDATGSRTLAYNSVYKFPNGVTPVLSTAANAVDILTFVTDGTNMYGVCQKAFS